MRRILTLVAVASTGLLLLLPALRGAEETIPLDKVPKGVLDSVNKKYPGGNLKEAVKEVATDGKTSYEISLAAKTQNVTVITDDAGKITAIEKEIAAKDLPAEVTKGIQSKYAKATYKLIEELSDGAGKLTGYEIDIVTVANDSIEIVFDAQGKMTSETKAAPAPAKADPKSGK